MCRNFRHSEIGPGLLSLILVAMGCVTPVSYDPFKVPREQLRSDVRVVALAPLRVSSSIIDPRIARARFEPGVVRRLEAAGISVVSSSVWEEVWRGVGTDVGQIYDESTGVVNEERYEMVQSEVYRRLRSEHDVDAIVYLSISTISLHMTWASELEFCGGERPAYWPGGWSGGRSDRATLVIAACLSAALYDFDDHQLYGIRTALEVLQTYAHQTRAVRPEDERFRDELQNMSAIASVVGPLADNFAHSPESENEEPR